MREKLVTSAPRLGNSLVAPRRISRQVMVGDVPLGGGAPVVIQSMCDTKTRDYSATMRQILALAKAGCQLVRVAVPEDEDARALKDIVRHSPLPVIADIHYTPQHALMAIEAGVHKVRLNPGTCVVTDWAKRIAREVREAGIPIRIGVNSGSIAKRYVDEFVNDPAGTMVKSALDYIKIMQDEGVEDIVVSLKSTDVETMVQANRQFAQLSDLPLHLGVTEAGPGVGGAARSTVGLSLLLAEGIGDTIRVSLTDNPVEEVKVAKEILAALDLLPDHIKLVACPTCGRINYDLYKLIELVQDYLEELEVSGKLTVAVMGCEVNGPGECREADVGIAAGRGNFLIYREGKIVRSKLTFDELLPALKEEIETFLASRGA